MARCIGVQLHINSHFQVQQHINSHLSVLPQISSHFRAQNQVNNLSPPTIPTIIMVTSAEELRCRSSRDLMRRPIETARILCILPPRKCFQVSGTFTSLKYVLTRLDDDTQSFLHDPLNHIDTFSMSNSFQAYKDNTGRQLRHIFITSLSRWLITAGLCAAMIFVTRIWQSKVAISENSKKMYNTITTGISIALGLNIASAFKDMALNMRWSILSARARSLVEVSWIHQR